MLLYKIEVHMTNKQEAIKVISSLPDSVNFEEIMYKLYVLGQIHRGQEEVEKGQITAIIDLELETANW
jgi:stalled ribosome rescue protein Dom34